MYLQWEYDDSARQEKASRPWEPNNLGVVLTSEGDTFEQRQLQLLESATTEMYGIQPDTVSDLSFTETWADEADAGLANVRRIAGVVAERPADGHTTLIFQPHLRGQIGAYELAGKGDILVLEPTPDGVRPTVLEVKSSSEQKVYHRYQATIYAVLLEQQLADADILLAREGDGVAAKIITPENDLADGIAAADGFVVSPYQAKLELKLEAGGSFDQTILDTPFERTTNRIARRCSGCEYEPLCMTRAVESQGLELLGLQAGTQEKLHQLGIDTVSDFADLYAEDFEDSVHWDDSTPMPRDYDLARQVRREAEVTNLQKRVQIAYRFISELDDRYGNNPDFYATPLRGTGNNLPEDEHDADTVDWTQYGPPDYPSGGLVRVYLYVQQDHAQDRITLLAAQVACTHTGFEESIVELPTEIPTTDAEKDAEEDRLFQAFFTKLAAVVEEANPDYETDPAFAELDVPEDHGFLHLYFYSREQRDALVDAIDAHRPSPWGRPLRTLLGLRAGIDQEMVSIIQDDFRQRWALRFPGLGLIQSTAQFRLQHTEWFDWRPEIEIEDMTVEISVDTVFDTGLFDGGIRYRSHHGRNLRGEVSLDHTDTRRLWTPDDKRIAQWYYPVTNRETDQIPVEYLWGVYGRLTEDAAENPADVRPYLYRDDEHTDAVSEFDLQAVATQFARATEHIERTIQRDNRYATNRFVDKQPIPIEALSNFQFGPRTLQEVCIEYQQLEYETDRTELEAYYRQPLEERVDSGSSFVFQCTNVDDDGAQIEGRLYEPTETGYVAVTDRVTVQSLSVSSSDFMVLTRLDPDSNGIPEQPRNDTKRNIANSTTVIIGAVNDDGSTLLSAPFKSPGWPSYGRYTVGHRGWSPDSAVIDEEWTTYIAEGELYVVDPMADKITQNRAYEALVHATDTPIHRWVTELYEGDRQRVDIDRWDTTVVGAYLDRMADAPGFSRPRDGQDEFAEDVSHGLITLQGPPGTGKTRYTISPAVLGRVHADIEAGRGHLGVISAVSHNAVNEALEAILELHDACPPGGGDDVAFIRVCSSRGQGVHDPRVQNVYYNQADDDELLDLFDRYLGPDADDSARALFFGPPVSIRSCLNTMLRLHSADDEERLRIADWMTSGESACFDLAVIDEASMMDLPLFFLLGSFVAAGGQMMLVGDHRQMQPIQKHDWAAEDRAPIERHRPFFSALDFFRFLRGDPTVDIDYINRDPPDLADPAAALPDHKLRATYRLPPESAQLHTDLFYDQDGITLQSRGDNAFLPATTGPMADILNSEDRVVLLVHDENRSQKSNTVEQALAAELMGHDGFEITATDAGDLAADEITAGVVVPFRAQRRDIVENVPAATAVDTVERFQGGERDLIILSMTASDRGYISQLSEFLLEPNRFNVGASRMKRKLIILASSAIFEESSNDVEAFEDQQAWISFFQAMGGLEETPTPIPVTDLLSPDTQVHVLDPDDRATTIRIYSGYDR